MKQVFIKKDTPLKEFNKHWQFGVGSCHAVLALRVDYCRQLRMVQEELGIKRVRFHGILSDEMHTLHSMKDILPLPGAKRFTEQSFRLCGKAYDNILDCNMQPFVELSFMPQMLAKKNKKGLFYYKPNISLPKDDEKWATYIKDFISFLLRRYGNEEVEEWFFEVWNEPDLKVAFFDGNQEDYFRLYAITVKAIKSVNPKLKVGGPSTSGSRWVAAFVKYCKENNVPVDFVSTHQYAGDPLGGVKEGEDAPEMKINPIKLLTKFKGVPSGSVLDAMRHLTPDKSEIEDIPNDIFVKHAAIVKEQADGLPVYYTEWNENATFSAYTNDTRKVAAYAVKTILNTENLIDGSFLWGFSDIYEELHPFSEEFHGGFGLLSQSGIPKPAYHAFKMLNMVGDYRYELPTATSDEITVAAFQKNEKKHILITRQKMKNLQLPSEQIDVSVELDKAPKSVRIYRIDEEHCNPLREWKKRNSILDLTKEEVSEIIRESEMKAEDIKYEYSNNVLKVSPQLFVNDVYLIEIEEER
jgi:Glycosyl hydrolases family 39.